MIERLVEWEREFFLFLNSQHTPYLDGVMYMISDRYPWIVLSALLLFIFVYRQPKREVLLLFLAIGFMVFLGDQLSSQIFKPLVARYRPTHHPLTRDVVVTVLGYRGNLYGFISGHATNFIAFATFTSLLLRRRLYTIVVFVTTLTVVYSRIYLGVHFITDVVPGVFCGGIVGGLTYYLYQEARHLFFAASSDASTPLPSPYLSARRVTLLTYVMGGGYLSFWLLSPFFFPLYF